MIVANVATATATVVAAPTATVATTYYCCCYYDHTKISWWMDEVIIRVYLPVTTQRTCKRVVNKLCLNSISSKNKYIAYITAWCISSVLWRWSLRQIGFCPATIDGLLPLQNVTCVVIPVNEVSFSASLSCVEQGAGVCIKRTSVISSGVLADERLPSGHWLLELVFKGNAP